MRVSYLIEWDAFQKSGVAKKIKSQIGAWKELGHLVQLIVISPKPRIKNLEPIFEGENVTILTHAQYWGLGKLFKSIALIAAKKKINEFKPDVLYYRQSSWTPGIISLLKEVKTRIIEVNSDDASEIAHYGAIKAKYHLLTRSMVISASSGFVCVSKEISQKYAEFAKPIAVISNGFDLRSVTPRPAITAMPIRAIFVGSDGQAWHGVDKIIQLARSLPSIEFHIAGISNLGAATPKNTVIHGPMDWARLNDLYQKMDFGIGTLALHRKDMNEASPLKTREYVAYGLPVIGAYYDTDLSGCDFFLEIENTESGVENAKDRILSFANSWKGRSIDAHTVSSLIDSRLKERLRLKFMGELAGIA